MQGLLFSLSFGVVGLGSNLIGSAGVAGLDRLLTLMTYIGYTRCRLFF